MATEWRVYSRDQVDRPWLGVRHEVKAFLRWDEPVPVVESHVPPWGAGNARPGRAPRVLSNPDEIRVTYRWVSRGEVWLPAKVTLGGRGPRAGDCEGGDDCECDVPYVVRVDPKVRSTPEPVRRFVEWATPTEVAEAWVGYDHGHGFYRRVN